MDICGYIGVGQRKELNYLQQRMATAIEGRRPPISPGEGEGLHSESFQHSNKNKINGLGENSRSKKHSPHQKGLGDGERFA